MNHPHKILIMLTRAPHYSFADVFDMAEKKDRPFLTSMLLSAPMHKYQIYIPCDIIVI